MEAHLAKLKMSDLCSFAKRPAESTMAVQAVCLGKQSEGSARMPV